MELLALLAIVMLGVWVRVDDMALWRQQAELAFVDGLPLLINLDGYYFLSLARDLLEGSYAPVDTLRAAPMGVPRPQPAPLLSLLTAGVTRVSGLPLDWAATLLPALLGPLLALPVYGIGRRLAGPAAGLAAALVAVLSHYYVYRSTAGFHDTDCLNVVFATALAWWALRLADAPARRFMGWLAAGFALFIVYLWWWHGAYPAVTALGLWSLACALVARRAGRREWLIAGVGCGGLVLLALIRAGVDLPQRFAERVMSTIGHVTKAPGGDFPNLASSIGEQAPLDLAEAAEKTLGDPVLLGVACAGFAWLVFRHWRAGLMLLPLLVLATMSVLFAQRFLIFAAPLTGLGVGMLTARALAVAHGRRWVQAAVMAGVAALAGPSLYRSISIVFMPAAHGELVAGMRWASRETPTDAVVWGLWDHGYDLRYWSRRATVNDGSVHTGELTVYNALPYAAPTFRLAANFMQFYSVHGQPGMQRVYRAAGGIADGLALVRQVLAAGPQDGRGILDRVALSAPGGGGTDGWLRLLFPANAPPLYLMLDQRMLYTARWWQWFGSWTPGQQGLPTARLEPFHGLSRDRDRIVGPRISVDTRTGTASIDGGADLPVSRVVTATTRGIDSRRYPQQGPEFHYAAVQGFGVLQDPSLAASVFSKAFVLKAVARSHFQPARVWAGSVQLWRVRGDALPEAEGVAGRPSTDTALSSHCASHNLFIYSAC